jgi:hypothetical protein
MGRKNYKNFQQRQHDYSHGIQPTDVKGASNIKNCYHSNYLIHKIYSCFDLDLDYKNTRWPLNFFRFTALIHGNVAAFKKEEGIWILAPFTTVHRDVYFNPIRIKIAEMNYDYYDGKVSYDSDMLIKEYEVGEDAFIFKAFDDYRGFSDLIINTSSTLANIDKAVNIAVMNNNVNFLAYARSQAEADNIRLAYAQATAGEPLVVISKDYEPEEGKDLLSSFASSYPANMLDKLLTARRTVMNNFLTEIGINNANVDKKERLNSMEVNSNSEEVSANVTLVYKNLKDAFDAFNEKTSMKLKIDLHFNYEEKDIVVNDILEGGEEDAKTSTRAQSMGTK